jgi:hypothetical protein
MDSDLKLLVSCECHVYLIPLSVIKYTRLYHSAIQDHEIEFEGLASSCQFRIAKFEFSKIPGKFVSGN